MSEQQATAKKRTFNEASANRKPTLVCTGYVSKVDTTEVSKSSGNYNVTPIHINGIGASRSQSVYLLTRPEWFAVDAEGNPIFRPNDLEKVEGGKGMLFVYRKNISGRGSVSTLRGLAGNDERFENLQDALLSDEETSDEALSADAITKILQKYLVAKEGTDVFEIGYVLRQQRTKSDEEDENGKPIYLLENKYEISEFWEATEENKKKYRKAAEKNAKKAQENDTPVTFKVCFDAEQPF